MSGINSSLKTSNATPPAGAGATTEAASAPTVSSTTTTSDSTAYGMVSIINSFVDPLRNMMNSLISGRNETYMDLEKINESYQWLKQVYDNLKQPLSPGALVWEGPGKITGWPTGLRALDFTIVYEEKLEQIGVTLDRSLKDKLTYMDWDGKQLFLDKGTEYEGALPRVYNRSEVIDKLHANNIWDIPDRDEDIIAKFWKNPCYVDIPYRGIYRISYNPKTGRNEKTYVAEYMSDANTKQLSLLTYGNEYASETKRLKDAGLVITQYDAYQFTVGGKTGYTTVNQILGRDSTDFSNIPDQTIVAVGGASGNDYYLVNKGQGQKLDNPPEGILMGLPTTVEPSGNVRYTDAIVATTDLVQSNFKVTIGDYDMGMYFYGGGQVGYAKMPPVVVNVDPQTTYTVTYPPGTLLQYTDAQNEVSYYHVTGTGVAKVEDPANFAKAVKGTPPDLSSVDPGTLVKLDDGKLYWVTSDKKTMSADGAPLLRFMSPEQKAKFDGIQLTEALQEAGLELSDGDMDAVRLKGKNGDTIVAKLPTKIFNGPGTEPRASDYAPGDVIESKDKSKAWYIDEKGAVQKAESCIELKASNVRVKDFDPKNYNPGDVVGLDNGIYYRITFDHKKVKISYPLEKFILNPSPEQIASLQGKLLDQSNNNSSNMNRLALKLQELQAQNNTLATMIANLVSGIKEMYSKSINAMV